jgi:SAM-dependent methyltransferase
MTWWRRAPGPGATTDVLREHVARLTAVELDPDLAAALRTRFAGTNVTVVESDATQMPFEANRFSAGICLTMLHHVPTAELQDRLLAELGRVVRSGGTVIGSDNLDSPDFRIAHEGDICNPIDPAELSERLEALGFTQVHVEQNPYAFAFTAKAP